MYIQDWRQLAAAINADIAAMTRAVQTQADVREVLERRREDPTEEQFIDEDAFDSLPGEPRVFEVAGAEVKVWKGINLDTHPKRS